MEKVGQKLSKAQLELALMDDRSKVYSDIKNEDFKEKLQVWEKDSMMR